MFIDHTGWSVLWGYYDQSYSVDIEYPHSTLNDMRDPPSQSRRNFNVWMCSSEYNKIFSPSQSVSAIYSLLENIIKTWRNGQSNWQETFCILNCRPIIFFIKKLTWHQKLLRNIETLSDCNSGYITYISPIYFLRYAIQKKGNKKERKKQLWFYVPHETAGCD